MVHLKIARWLLAATLAAMAGGCGTPSPKAAAPPPPVSPAGLGDTLQQVVHEYGLPTSSPMPMSHGAGIVNFRHGLTVEFLSGRAEMLQAEFSSAQGRAGAIQAWGMQLSPKDATDAGMEHTNMGTAFIHHSRALAKAFPRRDFLGASPGTYTVIQQSVGSDVVLTYAIGNNP